jgi:acetate kinase
MDFNVLVLDPGSSSLKFGLYGWAKAPRGSEPALLAGGAIDRLGSPESELKLEVRGQPTQRESMKASSPAHGAEIVLQRLQAVIAGAPNGAIQAVGCRVVHGGDLFKEPTLVTPAVIEGIRELSPLAPLHNPASADVLAACLRLLPDVPAIAVFDTTFHRTLPPVASVYALPYALCEEHHLHRYGFHGIAHRYVSGRLVEFLGRTGGESRCITCHLGSGASLCAVRNGLSIDTSMGMTPMEGLVMGTRSGDVDPGLLLTLLRTVGMTPEELDEMLNHKSGLLGISGRSGDLRDLEPAAAAGDARSELAMELFAYRAAKTIGAYAVALEGLDGLAFSGGIGEHSASMRRRICRRLGILGVTLQEERNRAGDTGEAKLISAETSEVQVWVIPADENLQITRDVFALREKLVKSNRRH